jgi:hypothetical protein
MRGGIIARVLPSPRGTCAVLRCRILFGSCGDQDFDEHCLLAETPGCTFYERASVHLGPVQTAGCAQTAWGAARRAQHQAHRLDSAVTGYALRAGETDKARRPRRHGPAGRGIGSAGLRSLQPVVGQLGAQTGGLLSAPKEGLLRSWVGGGSLQVRGQRRLGLTYIFFCGLQGLTQASPQ